MNNKNILICLILFLLSGCMSGKVPEFTKDVVIFPENVLGKIAIPDRNDTVRATAHITIDSHEGKYSGKMALLLKMPSDLRIETIPVFGPSDFFLSANDESLKVFFPGEGKFYVGRATKENLFLFFKVFLSPRDVVPILAGLPPQTIEGNLSERVEGGLYRVDIRSGRRVRSLWVHPGDYTLTRIEDRDDGRLTYRVAFNGHMVVDEIPYAKEIRIEVMEPSRVRVDVRYINLDVVADGDRSVFDLKTPYGITPVFLD